MPERNIDRTDRELLMVIDQIAGPNGFATSNDIGLQLGYSISNGNGDKRRITPASRVGGRLGWMRAFGFLEKIDPEPGTPRISQNSRWRLTPVGRDLMKGQLTKAVQSAIDRMEPGAKILMMRQLTLRGIVEAPAPVATAIRREYQHNAARRR